MNRAPDITLTGRISNHDEEIRELYLWECQSDTQITFSYRFSDWYDVDNAYFMLVDGIVYFNRDEPVIKQYDQVSDEYRPHAYSNSEIRSAIENYLIEKLIFTEH